MNVILFDDPAIRTNLLPFTFTRPVGAIRVGILTLEEKWAHWLKTTPCFQTEGYLRKKYPVRHTTDNLLINGALCPDEKLVSAILSLPPGRFLVQAQTLLAARQPEAEMSVHNTLEYHEPVTLIDHSWKIFRENGNQVKADFKRITEGRRSQPITDPHTRVYNPENIFLEEGVYIRAAILNAENGPIYLGKNSTVQEGAILRGTVALCEGAHINMGGKIRGDVTVGPYSKVGGEVSTSVIFGNSNKAHDGFLGCSVIGEWCNLGADTNTSNLKNNYDNVKLWSHNTATFEDTGLQFCGLMMGDHSKCSINTMFNTGTTVDVSANVFGDGFPPAYIPSFTWGGSGMPTTYRLDKALETGQRTFARRNTELNETEREILAHIYNITAPSRAQFRS
jgi:UDP-N-acetylglucosamine diphosphorylase/glucosamine-1-phosphate N-acetyltransferase